MRVEPHHETRIITIRSYSSPDRITQREFRVGMYIFSLTDKALKGEPGWWLRRDDSELFYNVDHDTASGCAVGLGAEVTYVVEKMLMGEESMDAVQGIVDIAMALLGLMKYYGYLGKFSYTYYRDYICKRLIEKGGIYWMEG